MRAKISQKDYKICMFLLYLSRSCVLDPVPWRGFLCVCLIVKKEFYLFYKINVLFIYIFCMIMIFYKSYDKLKWNINYFLIYVLNWCFFFAFFFIFLYIIMWNKCNWWNGCYMCCKHPSRILCMNKKVLWYLTFCWCI